MARSERADRWLDGDAGGRGMSVGWKGTNGEADKGAKTANTRVRRAIMGVGGGGQEGGERRNKK